MSAKSSFGSSYAGVFSEPISGSIGSSSVIDVSTTVANIASGTTNTQTLAVLPAGIWMACVNFDVSSQGGNLLNVAVVGTCGAYVANTSITVATGAVLTAYQPSLSFVIVSDGTNPFTVGTTCTTSAGTWSLLDTSLATVVRIA